MYAVSTEARTVRIRPVKMGQEAMSGTASVGTGVKRSGKARAHGTNHRKLAPASNRWPVDGQTAGSSILLEARDSSREMDSACGQHKMTVGSLWAVF